MGYIQGADRNQLVFLPNTLDDYVDENNEVRAIDIFIDSLDMGSMGFKTEPAREGRPGYDPRDMLKLYMYGYLNHIRSSRRLQKEAGRNVEVMWLLRTVVPDFRCIADFRKDNAKAIKAVFTAFVKLCNRAGLLSRKSVVIDGTKIKAVNADHKCYLSGNVSKMIKEIEDKVERYMKALDEYDEREAKPGELNKEDIAGVLNYLDRRKCQLKNAQAQIEAGEENQVCATDPECRVMKSNHGIGPCYNVQTAVETENHIIVHYDVTDECVDLNLLEAGITGAKTALEVENIEGIADKGYSSTNEIWKCLLNGDTPTTHPNRGERCRIFRFRKTNDVITEEMLLSKDPEVLMRCVSAGILPRVLQRDDLEMTLHKHRPAGSSLYMHKETGEVVSLAEMKAMGGLDRERVFVEWQPPLQDYFERDIEADTVICPMGQTLLYDGSQKHTREKATGARRYRRLVACKKCNNRCTLAQTRTVSFKEGEIRKPETFYQRAACGLITRRTNLSFRKIEAPSGEGPWEESVILRFYPNQRHLRKRSAIVEHPYGTVKRWHGASYLLTKGKVKAAAETGLSFLAYNFRRVINLLGTTGLIELIRA